MAHTDRADSRTHVAAEASAACPFSMADEYAAEYLRAAEARGSEAVVGIPWRLPIFRYRVSLSFGIHADIVDHGRAHDELRVRWTSETNLLPDFHGSIRFRIDGALTRVLVDGTYQPPLGAFGRVFDCVVGAWIARSTLQDLADRIAAYLTAREGGWRSEQRLAPNAVLAEGNAAD